MCRDRAWKQSFLHYFTIIGRHNFESVMPRFESLNPFLSNIDIAIHSIWTNMTAYSTCNEAIMWITEISVCNCMYSYLCSKRYGWEKTKQNTCLSTNQFSSLQLTIIKQNTKKQ